MTTPEAQPSHRVSYAAAARILATRDPVIARLVADAGLPRLRRAQQAPLATLVQAIVAQQPAGAAAAATHRRLITALNSDVQPEALIALADASLRTVGLSANKAASLRQSDEEIVAPLSTVWGIGRWTAEMFLMFQLRRLDVWPTGDLGVRRGYGLAWKVPVPGGRELQPLGDRYRPSRSVVAWYCWRPRSSTPGPQTAP